MGKGNTPGPSEYFTLLRANILLFWQKISEEYYSSHKDSRNVQDYKECQDDIQAVSGIVEEIQDALLDYQVGGDQVYMAVVTLITGCFDVAG